MATQALKGLIAQADHAAKFAAKNNDLLTIQALKNRNGRNKLNGKNGSNGSNGSNGESSTIPAPKKSKPKDPWEQQPIEGPLKERPETLQPYEEGETIAKSLEEALFRKRNRFISQKDGRLKDARIKKRGDLWRAEPEDVQKRHFNKGSSNPKRLERLKRQTASDAPPRTDVSPKGKHAHHIVGLFKADPLFVGLPEYKRKALIRFLEERGFFTGDHPKNIALLEEKIHKAIHDFISHEQLLELSSVGDAPVTARWSNILKFMRDQRIVNEKLIGLQDG